MNMIEKVARAIHESNRKSNQALFDDCNETYKNICFVKARAAIEAMREPTEEMIKPFRSTASDDYILRCWPNMIDAALKE